MPDRLTELAAVDEQAGASVAPARRAADAAAVAELDASNEHVAEIPACRATTARDSGASAAWPANAVDPLATADEAAATPEVAENTVDADAIDAPAAANVPLATKLTRAALDSSSDANDADAVAVNVTEAAAMAAMTGARTDVAANATERALISACANASEPATRTHDRAPVTSAATVPQSSVNVVDVVMRGVTPVEIEILFDSCPLAILIPAPDEADPIDA